MLFMSCVCSLLSRGHLLGEHLTSWLLFVMFNCIFGTFPCGILSLALYLIISISDLCRLSYFEYSQFVLYVPRLSKVTCATWLFGGGQIPP